MIEFITWRLGLRRAIFAFATLLSS
ncbi:MAG: hypothetical protein RL235_439, partial [Chlamydiota bacterium]